MIGRRWLGRAVLSNGSAMADQKDKGESLAHDSRSESRKRRLKLALRENLKRRKAQARGRGDGSVTSSEEAEVSLDDASEREPDE